MLGFLTRPAALVLLGHVAKNASTSRAYSLTAHLLNTLSFAGLILNSTQTRTAPFSIFDFGDIKGRHALTDFPTFSETNSLRSIITATGRIGYLWTPTFLGYGKVGIAFLRDRNSVFLPSGVLFESASFTLPAMTAGVGGEWMFAPNWSVFAEWNYIWIEDDAAQHFTPSPGLVGETLNTRQRAQTALVGVNYKFHWDGPVVAKY